MALALGLSLGSEYRHTPLYGSCKRHYVVLLPKVACCFDSIKMAVASSFCKKFTSDGAKLDSALVFIDL